MELKSHQIQRQIESLKKDLALHQKRCKHKKKTWTHRSSTDNFDPSVDGSWTTFTCPTCLKTWTEDGNYVSPEERSRFAQSMKKYFENRA